MIPDGDSRTPREKREYDELVASLENPADDILDHVEAEAGAPTAAINRSHDRTCEDLLMSRAVKLQFSLNCSQDKLTKCMELINRGRLCSSPV
jgi:hypothetical protein